MTSSSWPARSLGTKPDKEAKSRPVTVLAGKKSWKTKLSPDHLQRLIVWKSDRYTSLPDEPVAKI